jgi:membrane dipeptidase
MDLLVDAHEDIAWNAVALNRDVLQPVEETRSKEVDSPGGRCMLGLQEWLEGRVAVVGGSIFLSPARISHSPWSLQTYADAGEAYRRGLAQVDVYHRLADASERIDLLHRQADLDGVLASWEGDRPRVGIFLTMEGADPIRDPQEMEEWYERGVRAVGLTWASGSRYAGGNGRPGPLTDAGRALLEVMAEFGVLLDVSHLADEALWETLDRYEGPVAATHANPRALVPGRRQLSDRMILALAERDGVVGIVPLNFFLKRGWTPSDGRQAVTLQDVTAAIDHVCQIVGDAAHVGLGSDFDGGCGAESAPMGLETVADLQLIGPALGERGYSEEHISAIMAGNWLRVLRRTLG